MSRTAFMTIQRKTDDELIWMWRILYLYAEIGFCPNVSKLTASIMDCVIVFTNNKVKSILFYKVRTICRRIRKTSFEQCFILNNMRVVNFFYNSSIFIKWLEFSSCVISLRSEHRLLITLNGSNPSNVVAIVWNVNKVDMVFYFNTNVLIIF